MTPKPVTMWAAIQDYNRRIRVFAVGSTRGDAKRQFIHWLGDDASAVRACNNYLKEGKVRLAHVVVAEEGGK